MLEKMFHVETHPVVKTMNELVRLVEECDKAMIELQKALFGDSRIAENMRDYWKNLGVND